MIEIESQLQNIRNDLGSYNLSDDKLFSHLILSVFYNQPITDQIITDGPNDGGIDFIYYSDEDNKLVLGQSKYTSSLTRNEIVDELNKMYNTVNNFKKSITGGYNENLKRELQNALDQLPDDQSGNIEYNIFTKADIDNIEGLLSSLENSLPENFPIDSIKIFSLKDITKTIEAFNSKINTVTEDKIKIDRPKNFLKYESDVFEGLMCNVWSSSIKRLYNKHQNNGLFDLNIRRYIPNKSVDKGIKETLDHERDNFWFLNNGIIIACQEFRHDGDMIHLYDFSIVNGGQTTQLIGNYESKNSSDFVIPCKIVAVKDKRKAPTYFNRIAEATNSQKPILPRDLKSNSREMISLKNLLDNNNIYLDIKRGSKKPKSKKFKSSIKNDELGQLILSFIFQQPGTSRSGKRVIFENENIYGKIYKEQYGKVPEKKQFLLDIIDLNNRYKILEESYKDKEDTNHTLSSEQLVILKNGKQTIFALMGLVYRLANEDILKDQILNDPHYAEAIPFEFGSILSNYKEDDLEYKLGQIIYTLINIVTELYQKAYDDGKVTSVSNFMKTDGRYYSDIVKRFMNYLNYADGRNLKENWNIFKRK